MDRQSTEDFYGSENTLHTILIIDTCQYTSAQTHRIHNTKNEPHCEAWTWVTVMCQGSFISEQMHRRGGKADNGGGCVWTGAASIWNISLPSSSFCCEPETAQ